MSQKFVMFKNLEVLLRLHKLEFLYATRKNSVSTVEKFTYHPLFYLLSVTENINVASNKLIECLLSIHFCIILHFVQRTVYFGSLRMWAFLCSCCCMHVVLIIVVNGGFKLSKLNRVHNGAYTNSTYKPRNYGGLRVL